MKGKKVPELIFGIAKKISILSCQKLDYPDKFNKKTPTKS